MPREHLVCGVALAVVLWILGIGFIPICIIILASILIDIDHAINYINIFKRCNIIEMFSYFRRDVSLKNSTIPLPVFIFHNYETIFIIALLSQFYPFMLFVLAGVAFHMFIDWGVMPTDRYPAVIKLSLILVLLENGRRRRGYSKW